MKSKVSKKLNSNSGASITFALLLFLVCAALSAVTLVAATAAAGRMAGIAETDQRYYSVTSAAEFVRDLVDGKTVTVVDDKHIEKPADAVTGSDLDSSAASSTTPEVDEDAEKLVKDVDSEPVDGSSGIVEETKFTYDLADIVLGNSDKTTWNITGSSELSKDILAVTIEGKKSSDKIIVDVLNTSGGPFEKPYTLRIELDAQTRDVTDSVRAVKSNITKANEVTLHVYNIQSLYDDGNTDAETSGD